MQDSVTRQFYRHGKINEPFLPPCLAFNEQEWYSGMVSMCV